MSVETSDFFLFLMHQLGHKEKSVCEELLISGVEQSVTVIISTDVI